MIFKFTIGLFFILTLISKNYCQNLDQIIKDIIENNYENQREIDISELSDKLSYFFENKINLNSNCHDQLFELGFLNQVQINSIMDYKYEYGTFYSRYELQLINTIDYETMRLLNFFIKIEDEDTTIDNYYWYKQQVFLYTGFNIEDSKGYQQNTYLGDKYYSQLRYNASLGNNYNLNLVGESDAGENLNLNNYGFDFYSINLNYKSKGVFKSFHIGDYELNIGQGLQYNSPYGVSKFAIKNISKGKNYIKAKKSAAEYGFLRGIAIENRISKKTNIISFASYKYLDGTLKDNGDYTIINNGYNRTYSESLKQNTIQEFNTGFNINYTQDFIRVGSSFTYNSMVFADSISLKQNPIVSADIKYIKDNNFIFGELAFSNFNYPAYIIGLTKVLDSKLYLSLIHRNYHSQYSHIYANPFSEKSNFSGEQGVYLGLDFILGKYINIISYIDFYKSNLITSINKYPLQGNDFYLKLKAKYKSKTDIEVSFKTEKYESIINDESKTLSITNSQLNRYKIKLDYQLNEKIRLTTRTYFTEFFSKDKEKGLLFAVDFNYLTYKKRIKTNIRVSIFDTDSHKSGIYVYENNLKYIFAVPVYYQKGVRYFLNFKYKVNKKFNVFFRYAATKYSNRESIGTGNNLINGNMKSDFKIQIMLNL